MKTESLLAREPLFWSRVGFAEDPTRRDLQGKILFKERDWTDYIAEHRSFFRAGVKCHTTILHNGWVGVDQYDFSGTDRTLEAICEISPDIRYMPRIKLNAPAAWCERYPEELYLSEHAPRAPEEIRRVFREQLPFFSTPGLEWDYPDAGCAVGLQSFCSEKWLEDASCALRMLLAHIDQTPYADQIIGYQIGFGMCAENAYWGGWVSPRRFGDFGLAAAEKFAEYCAGLYGSRQAAAEAFHIEEFNDAVQLIPGSARRCHTPENLEDYFRYGNDQCAVYSRFLSETTADAVCRFAEVIKTETGKPAGAFYGYLFSSYPGQIGHLAVQRLLDCAALDFLSSPKGYYRSGPGEPGGAQGMSLSVTRKKLWLDELDNGTYLGRRVHHKDYYPADLPETRTVLWREVAKNLAWNNQNFWWMDLGGGWFRDEAVMRLFPPLLQFIRKVRSMPRKSLCEILLIVDEDSLYWQNEDANFMGGHHKAIVNEMASELLLCGAPVEQYRLRDLLEMDLFSYKLIVFANAFAVDEKTRAYLKTNLPPDTLCLWHYAAGIRNHGYSLDHVRDLTGLSVEPYEMGFDASNGYGIDVKLPPIRILPEDGIAIQKRRADGTICTARRGNHILCVSPDFRSEDFFALASEAGCRMYAPPHCTVYGDSRFMAFFPQQDQNAVLFLPEAGEYEELLTGKHCSGFATWPVRLKAKDALVFMRV